MELLEKIPVFNLHGGEFLLAFGLFATAVALVAYLGFRASDDSDASSPPRVPTRPDPLEVAYLAGGVQGVLRTALYDLHRRGLIDVGKDGRVFHTGVSATRPESQADRLLLDATRDNPKAAALMRQKMLREAAERLCAPVRGRLAAQDLLLAEESRRRIWRIAFAAAGFILAVAGLKIALAISQGRSNVGFLVGLAILASFLLFPLALKYAGGTANRKGRAYLAQMRRAFSSLKAQAAHAPVYDGGTLFLVGLFGYEMLKGAPGQNFAAAFRSPSDGGGGDGGGGGGCGGGGCGG